jgi:hypothetical protein
MAKLTFDKTKIPSKAKAFRSKVEVKSSVEWQKTPLQMAGNPTTPALWKL